MARCKKVCSLATKISPAALTVHVVMLRWAISVYPLASVYLPTPIQTTGSFGRTVAPIRLERIRTASNTVKVSHEICRLILRSYA